jgi:hypothetical protein
VFAISTAFQTDWKVFLGINTLAYLERECHKNVFPLPLTLWKKARVFVPNQLFQSSLGWLKWPAGDKHSSLFVCNVSDEEKKSFIMLCQDLLRVGKTR